MVHSTHVWIYCIDSHSVHTPRWRQGCCHITKTSNTPSASHTTKTTLGSPSHVHTTCAITQGLINIEECKKHFKRRGKGSRFDIRCKTTVEQITRSSQKDSVVKKKKKKHLGTIKSNLAASGKTCCPCS